MKAARSQARKPNPSTAEILAGLLKSPFEFHGQASGYASHNFHAYAAKFPPQLPRVFIEELTAPGEAVLDPMMGSGTTLVEALHCGRRAIGCDLDPLAVRIARIKSRADDIPALEGSLRDLLASLFQIFWDASNLDKELRRRFSDHDQAFIDYWFLPQTQRELMALILAIEQESDPAIREFLEVVLSSIIVTKSGGVSRARDLAHSRPHLDKTKTPREAISQFEAKARKMIRALAERPTFATEAEIHLSDARQLPLADDSVDLIVTSPPYANAIDYMRAHKFSLVWLGEKMADLSEKRSTYIGSERIRRHAPEELPEKVRIVVERLTEKDPKKAKVLGQYFLDMDRVFGEMKRVLKPGRAAIMVIGTSTMRGMDVETHLCLVELSRRQGFQVVGIKERKLDRNRRMMPARFKSKVSSIENRMHQEYILALLKEGVI